MTHLGVPSAKYKALYEESRGNPVRACFEGLVFWRNGNEPCRPATWSVLLEALEKGAEKREYAKSLRQGIVDTATKGEETAYQPSDEKVEHGKGSDLIKVIIKPFMCWYKGTFDHAMMSVYERQCNCTMHAGGGIHVCYVWVFLWNLSPYTC